MKDVYQEITDRILAQLEKGVVPWQKPWICLDHANFVSRQPYRGINSLMTSSSSFSCPYWVTFKQAVDFKGAIRRGEKSTPIVFWKFIKLVDTKGQPVINENGHQKIVPFIRYSNVFNLQQTDGIKIPEKPELPPFQPLERAQQIVDQANLCPIRTEGQQAAYRPDQDYIAMPAPETFKSSEGYFHTLYHEMTHASGHPSRLDRDLSGHFGSPKYAKEELTAELASCFLSHEAGIFGNLIFENSASYIDHWSKALKSDKSMIISAASAAQKASDFILGKKLDVEQTVSNLEQPLTTQGLAPAARLMAEHKINSREPSGESISV